MKYIAKPVTVKAYKIIHVDTINENGETHLIIYEPNILNQNETRIHKYATKEMTARMTPKIDDYWVIQEDGYEYLNPKEVFERKYELY